MWREKNETEFKDMAEIFEFDKLVHLKSKFQLFCVHFVPVSRLKNAAF